MAVTIVATPAAANANSYCTLAEANTYHESHPYSSTWDAATDDEKNRALVTATRLLDEQYTWEGEAANDTQALQWPREAVLDHLQLSYIDEAVIPSRLKDATAEFARQVLAGNRMADSDVETQGISSFSAGSVSFSFREDVDASAYVTPVAVRNMIPTWWGHLRSGQMWLEVKRS